MKKFLTFLLAIAAIFTFSFAAVAETSIKTESNSSVNFIQTKASPVAAATAGIPGKFTGVVFEFPSASAINKFFSTKEIGTINFSSNRTSWQIAPATTINLYNPPSDARLDVCSETTRLNGIARMDLIPPIANITSFRTAAAFRPDKRFSKNNFGKTLNRLFVARV